MERQKFYRTILFVVLMLFAELFLPLCTKATAQLFLLLVALIPTMVFVLSWLYGLLCGFHFPWTILVAGLSAMGILLYYNETALWFVAIHFLLALSGSFFGSLWRKK